MELKHHQLEAVDKAIPILKENGLVYIFGQPRIGKSLISLEITKNLPPKIPGRTIVFTKKSAINDWLKYKEWYDFDITNYEQVLKHNPNEYNFIIIDEAHNFGAFPKPSQRVKNFRKFCLRKPVIFLSGTPFVESPLSAYSQFSLSSFSPLRNFRNGYDFFRTYGIPSLAYLNGRTIETYKKAKPELSLVLDKYMVRITYEDAGFNYQNEDEVIYIRKGIKYEEIEEGTIKSWSIAEKYKVTHRNYWTPEGSYYLLENISAYNQALHMLCGGFYKDLNLPKPKLEWLINFANEHKNDNIAVMCYFTQEQEKLPKVLPSNCTVLSSTKYCEGIDLSYYDHFVLYSFGYSGAKFIQLRDRIVNIEKDRKTKVIIPLIKDSADYFVYETVSKKRNFNITMIRARYKEVGKI